MGQSANQPGSRFPSRGEESDDDRQPPDRRCIHKAFAICQAPSGDSQSVKWWSSSSSFQWIMKHICLSLRPCPRMLKPSFLFSECHAYREGAAAFPTLLLSFASLSMRERDRGRGPASGRGAERTRPASGLHPDTRRHSPVQTTPPRVFSTDAAGTVSGSGQMDAGKTPSGQKA